MTVAADTSTFAAALNPARRAPAPAPPRLGYILTHDTRRVSAHGGLPSLGDLARGLARTPRFAGQTRRWWSVLDHSLFVEALATFHATALGLDDGQRRAFRLYGLFHDAHEALTGDVPTPFKSAALTLTQLRLDERIANAYLPGGFDGLRAFHPELKALDRRALLAEALLVGPPALVTASDVGEHFGDRPVTADVDLLFEMLKHRQFSHPTDREADQQATFIRRYLELR